MNTIRFILTVFAGIALAALGLAFQALATIAASSPAASMRASENNFAELGSPTTVYLPVIFEIRSLTGRVTYQGKPVVDQYVNLIQKKSSDPTKESHYATVFTDSSGYYAFPNLPSQKFYDTFYVRIRLYDINYLRNWDCDLIDDPNTDNLICDIEISDVPFIAPGFGEAVTLPYAFKWYRRATSTDNYEIYFLDTGDRFSDLGYVSSYTITALPYTMGFGTDYNWKIVVHGPNGYGETYWQSQVIFNNRYSPVRME